MQELQDFKPYLPAELTLIEGSSTGERINIGDGTLPDAKSTDVDIRADLIRYLLLATDLKNPLHAKGIRLQGARILGILDLQGCTCENDISLTKCMFKKAPSFLNARMRSLHLNGCFVPGIIADNAIFSGSVFLRKGFESSEEISMPGVRISGDLQICDAHLSSKGKDCLFAASARIDGSVYLGDYPYDDSDSELHAKGALIFSSAKIEQDFYCKNCAISPSEVNPIRSLSFYGEESNELTVLSLERAEIGGVFFCKRNQISKGILNLAGAQVRRLNDEPTEETSGYKIRLDGFVYQDFSQEADMDVKSRLIWLERRPSNISFSAQPFEQLARVLGNIGHRDDVRDVLMRKERLQRLINQKTIRDSKSGLWRLPFLKFKDGLEGCLIGYGYRSSRAIWWGIAVIIALTVFFQKTWNEGDMTPNSAPILISKDWISATKNHPKNPAAFWTQPDQAGKDYETFSAIAYAADLVIPIVTLGQEAAWAPSTSRSWWGRQGWWIRWIAKTLGWILTALGAAALTGVIRRD